MAFLATMLAPMLGGLFGHSSNPELGTEGSLAALQAGMTADENSSIMTESALSHKSTQYASTLFTADENVREASLYNEFALSVQGSEQNIIKKSMTLVDQASQNA